MKVYVITKFRDSSFSQSEVKVGGGGGRGSFAPHYLKTKAIKPNQNRVKRNSDKVNEKWKKSLVLQTKMTDCSFKPLNYKQHGV